jgi:molybdenum cofactor cytidylyltransferase
MKRIKGILLSAGKSERMGTLKPLLKFGDEYLINILINEYLNSDISELVVVLGYAAETVKEKINPKFENVKIVVNQNFEKEMFSSIQAGLSVLSNTDGIVLGLIDHPFISSIIINMLIQHFDGSSIIIPIYNKRKGHPIVLPFSLKDEILTLNPETHSLRDVIHSHADVVKLVNIDSDAILFDMDRPEDYRKAVELWKR